MSDTYIAKTTINIQAPASAVWDALTKPELIKLYYYNTDVESDWYVGSPITWKGIWEGKPYEDKGTVLEFDPPVLLQYTHFSSLSGTADRPENHHTITYELFEDGSLTTVRLSQDNNPTQEAADKIAESSLAPVLERLKQQLELKSPEMISI